MSILRLSHQAGKRLALTAPRFIHQEGAMVVASEVDQVLGRAVDTGVVPGVVALAADDKGVVYAGAFGACEIDPERQMSLDTVMRIASMTKAVTSVAAMQLVEQGRIGLDEPLGTHVPELAAVQVLEGFDDAGTPRMRQPRRPITLRHLLTHTAGFAYDFAHDDLLRYHDYAGIPTIDERKKVCLEVPLVCDPGERWEYGISTDWVGQVVERLSGQSLEAYFREHILDPLNMSDTGFSLRPEQRARLAGMCERQPDGSFLGIAVEEPPDPEFFSGGGGLYSTGPDYLRFLRMLLGGGRLDGVQVLRPETIAAMGENQIGELTVEFSEFFPEMVKKWGLCAMITMDDASTGPAAGSLAWGGAYNTFFWIDPAQRVTGVFLTQILPFGAPGVLDLFARFERAIYASSGGHGLRPS
jgi:CubicO group peptidase (beta-lactamase class C family)